MVTSVRIMEGSKMKKRLSKIQVAMRSTGVTSRFNEHGLFAVTPVDEIFYKLTACRRDEDGRTYFTYRDNQWYVEKLTLTIYCVRL